MADGKQYALPWYAGNRVVMYNKKIWAQAGIKELPKTRAELFKAFDTIKQKTDAEPLYLPGQNWYFFDGLTIGTGADLVKKDGSKWVSNLGDPKVSKAMDIYKQYQAFSTAPKNKDEATPQQAEIFSKGKTGAIIAMGYEAPPPSRPTRPSRTTSASSRSRARPPTSPRASSSAAPTSPSPAAARTRSWPRSS